MKQCLISNIQNNMGVMQLPGIQPGKCLIRMGKAIIHRPHPMGRDIIRRPCLLRMAITRSMEKPMVINTQRLILVTRTIHSHNMDIHTDRNNN